MWNTTVRNGNGTWVNIRIRGTYHTTRNTNPVWHIDNEALRAELERIGIRREEPTTEQRGE